MTLIHYIDNIRVLIYELYGMQYVNNIMQYVTNIMQRVTNIIK